MLIERCHSTHQTAEEGGNKTHRASAVDGWPWCGTRVTFANSLAPAEVANRREASAYIDCVRCLRTIPGED